MDTQLLDLVIEEKHSRIAFEQAKKDVEEANRWFEKMERNWLKDKLNLVDFKEKELINESNQLVSERD